PRSSITSASCFRGWASSSRPSPGQTGPSSASTNQRGTAEQWIKEGKEATHWTRLSCHRFRANEVRLLLGVIACNLGNLLRRLVLPAAIQSWSLTSLQQRIFKAGGRLIRHARYVVLQLAESHLTQRLLRQILGRIERLAWSDVILNTGQRVGGNEQPE